MRTSAILISILVSAVLTAGCGGGESTADEPTGPPLTKAAFIKKGDEICGRVPGTYQEKYSALEKEREKEKQPKASKQEITEKATIPPLETALAGLKSLNPPKGDEEKAEAIIAALESAMKGVEEKPGVELTGPKSPFGEFQKLTGEYGFSSCARL